MNDPEHVAPGDQWVSRLIDSADPAANPHLDELLLDAVDAVATLRAEGRTVFLHCVMAQSRTPVVAALYAARVRGADAAAAWEGVLRALPAAAPNARFREAYGRLADG